MLGRVVLKRKKVEVCDFSTPYRKCAPVARRCEVVLGGETMEEVKVKLQSKCYLSLEMELELSERVVKGMSVVGTLGYIRNMDMDQEYLL